MVDEIENDFRPPKLRNEGKADNLDVLRLLLTKLSDAEWSRLSKEVRRGVPWRLVTDNMLTVLLVNLALNLDWVADTNAEPPEHPSVTLSPDPS